jgi:ATP/maltotriose-dependent transcriptional regulator MalT
VISTMHRGPMTVDEALLRFEALRPRAELNRRLRVFLMEATAQLEAMRGHFDIARALISKATTSAQEDGLLVLLDTHTRPAAGCVELLGGDPEAAERVLRVACEGMDRVGELGFLSSVVPLLVDALWGLDRTDEALTMTERWHVDRLTVPEDADAHIGWRRVRAKLLARKGDFVEAERLGREAVAIAAGTDYLDAKASAVADLGEVLRLVGQPDESTARSQEGIGLFELKGNVAAADALRARIGAVDIDA